MQTIVQVLIDPASKLWESPQKRANPGTPPAVQKTEPEKGQMLPGYKAPT